MNKDGGQDEPDIFGECTKSTQNLAETSAVSWMLLVLCLARDAPAESPPEIMGLYAH